MYLTKNLRLKTNSTTKEVYGLVNGRKTLILWDTKNENPDWKKKAIQEYKTKGV